MKYIYKMELVLVSITAALCTILVLKLIYKLRFFLTWRVNCWFCNSNFWVKYTERNSWICPKCEQYNGFTKDGDYNKPINSNSIQTLKTTPKVFQKSPPRNGLCKMCNVNQQLKVAQLANFVPMNENNFDEEIENYRLQLEKAYKLCSPCKRVVQMKLHKEKESLLGSKLLEARTPENRIQIKETQNGILKSFINNTSVFIAFILFILVLYDIFKNIRRYENLISTINNIKQIFITLLERIYSIVKMKTLHTFPILEGYDITKILYTDIMLPNMLHLKYKNIDNINIVTQKTLGGLVCMLQIVGNIWNVNSLKYTVAFDLLWSVFVVMSIIDQAVVLDPLFINCFKITSVIMIMLVSKSMNGRSERKTIRVQITTNRMKNLSSSSVNNLIDDEDSVMETDDDVSLSKFGLHNFSESSNETVSPLNSSMMNGRSFTPRTDSAWTKPKHNNSTFCVNTMLNKSPNSISDTVFVKPTFNKYQKLAKDDSDSELDESISSLCIGSPSKSKKKSNSVFSLRKFTASPNFVAPTPMTRSRPLISPSKLSHGTSWVAGGYWGSEGEHPMFSVNGSRSSSQSSGFESQTSSMNQRNVFSQPSSREESVCGEPVVMDRFTKADHTSNNYQAPQMWSPVYPQMQYNSHVHIPQSRFPQQRSSGKNVFNIQPQYVHNNLFKAPGGSGLIKLPQVDSFKSQ